MRTCTRYLVGAVCALLAVAAHAQTTNDPELPAGPASTTGASMLSAARPGDGAEKIVVTSVGSQMNDSMRSGISVDAAQLRGKLEALLSATTRLSPLPHTELIRRVRDSGLQCPDRLDNTAALQAARDAKVDYCLEAAVESLAWIRSSILKKAPVMRVTVTLKAFATRTPEAILFTASAAGESEGPAVTRNGGYDSNWSRNAPAVATEKALAGLRDPLAGWKPPLVPVKGVLADGTIVLGRPGLKVGTVLQAEEMVEQKDADGNVLFRRPAVIGNITVTESLPDVSLAKAVGTLTRTLRAGDLCKLVQPPK